MLHFETIRQYGEHFNHKPVHPLIALVDLSRSSPLPRTRFRMQFYAVVLKETRCGELRYGNTYYDYAEGTMVFFGPGQVVGNEPEGELHQPYGQALVFHPDLLKGTSLGRQIHDYAFFGYQSSEALHLSEKERETVLGCLAGIEAEVNQTIDRHSKKLIVANLNLLLDYGVRFYDRQFITRDPFNHGVVEQFERQLTAYLTGDSLRAHGLPTVAHFAGALHLSPNYFGDVIKKQTGQSPQEYIHQRLIDLAKERVLDPTRSVSEISYELGFKYPQHFTRFFRQKVGLSPNEYRGLN